MIKTKIVTNDIEENISIQKLHEYPNSLKISNYLIPEQLTINNCDVPLVLPYRSARKMKQLEHTMTKKINILNAKLCKQLNRMIHHYNNFNVHDSFKNIH